MVSAKWDSATHNIFLDLCEEEIQKGNRPNTTFSRSGWENLVKAFNEKANQDYCKKQLRNHYDEMRKKWSLFKTLIRGESGIGWDATKKTIDADESWWKAKIAENKKYKKFQGIDLSLYWFRYDAIFSNVAATGMSAQASTEVNVTDGQGSSYNVPYEEGDEEEDSDSNANKSDDKDFPCFGQSSLEKKRKADSNKEKQVKPKVTGASSLRESICDLVDLMKSRNASSSQPQDAPTMKECLDTLRGLPSLAAPVRYYAQLKFVKKEIREIFMDQQNDDDRVGFVQFLYDESHK